MIKKIIAWLKEKYNECFYIGSSEKLPPPLDSIEEKRLLLLTYQGDEEAKNKLIEHNLRLVVFLAKKYDNTGYEMEDLISIGTIGLIKGISTYKLDKNIKLATYASRCISNEILMFLRKNKKRKKEISLEDSLNYDNEGNELHLEYERQVEKNMLTKELNKLGDRDKQIMILRYGLNNGESYTQKEVADILGISQSYISRIEKKVIKNIKELMKVS